MDDHLEEAPFGLISFRDDGTIIRINHTLSHWLGHDDHSLEGRSIESILTVASRIFYNTHLFPLIRLHMKADEVFLTLRGKEKHEIPVLTNSVRKFIDEQYVNQTVFIPVYRRKKYEEEILQAKKSAEDALQKNEDLISLNRKLELRTQELDKQYSRLLAINQNLVQFSKIVSHDLQEPIHKIRLFTNMLGASGNMTEGDKTAIAKIQAAVGKLKTLTSGLEEFIKVDTDKVYADVNLNAALEKGKSKAIESRSFDNFTLATNSLPEIQGYEPQLVLLFFHLIDNSIAFRKTAEPLIIEVSGQVIEENLYRATPGKYKYVNHVKITFSDNGMGFENRYNQYVFDLVKKVNPDSKGLGIGLSLSKKIVDNHSGTISVESQPGVGSTFTILLPMKLH